MAMANGRGCASADSDHPMATDHLSGKAREEVDAMIGR